MRILGIIPARKGSKRVPQKNFRPFAGTTLTDLAIRQALQATCLDEVLVSSDSSEVLDIARQYDGVYTLHRPEELSTDQSLAIDYQAHAIDFMNRKFDKEYDWVVVIQPSSPFRTGKDIDLTVDLLRIHPEADSAVSVVKLPHMIHPHKLKLMAGDTLLPFLNDEKGKTAAQDLPDIFVRNGAVYVFKVANILNGIQLGDCSVGYVMLSETAIDINEMLDFEFAEFMYSRQVEIVKEL